MPRAAHILVPCHTPKGCGAQRGEACRQHRLTRGIQYRKAVRPHKNRIQNAHRTYPARGPIAYWSRAAGVTRRPTRRQEGEWVNSKKHAWIQSRRGTMLPACCLPEACLRGPGPGNGHSHERPSDKNACKTCLQLTNPS